MAKKVKECIVYSNYSWECDEHGKDACDYAREYLFDECNDGQWEKPEDIPDSTVWDEVNEENDINWQEFRREMATFLESGSFLLVGTVGRWNGTYAGGTYVETFGDIQRFWTDCDYVKVYDKGGHLYFEGSHHDGTNYAELRRVTRKGQELRERLENKWESDREIHAKIFKCNIYSALPHFARDVYGVDDGSRKPKKNETLPMAA